RGCGLVKDGGGCRFHRLVGGSGKLEDVVHHGLVVSGGGLVGSVVRLLGVGRRLGVGKGWLLVVWLGLGDGWLVGSMPEGGGGLGGGGEGVVGGEGVSEVLVNGEGLGCGRRWEGKRGGDCIKGLGGIGGGGKIEGRGMGR
ncbi:hypothetical protein ACHAWU_005654, partial [Discostella pseudostelligera]